MFRIDDTLSSFQNALHGLSESRPGEATNPVLGDPPSTRGGVDGAPLLGGGGGTHAPGVNNSGKWPVTADPFLGLDSL